MLKEIIKNKREEVAQRKRLYSLDLLKESPHYHAPCVSLRRYLLRQDKVGIIAEFKRRSPSQGSFSNGASVEEVSIGYMQAGASALSILTDSKYFGGSHDDLKIARTFNYCPILCKDFIVSSYQIHEARSYGADAILLIAAVLEQDQITTLAQQARALGMEVLLEVHDGDDLVKIQTGVDIIGVNNRNLKTMETSLQTSRDLIGDLPDESVRISESGMRSADDLRMLRELGYHGFLIGTHFMQSGDPKRACQELVAALHGLPHVKKVEA